MGNINVYRDKCRLIISNREGVKLLLSIFEIFPLNSTKYLDFLCFKKAFSIYQSRKGLNTEVLTKTILELKDSMNSKRVDSVMPVDHKINITKGWLLGYLEGDGSFSLDRNNLTPAFSLAATVEQDLLFHKIKEYLYNEFFFNDEYSLFKLRLGKAILIIRGGSGKVSNHKSSLTLRISNIKILHNYLVPYLDSVTFISKKGLDYQDFRLICQAVYKGVHTLDNIRRLILKLSYTMNNYRLSTREGEIDLLSDIERSLIANATPLREYLADGSVKDLVNNTITSNPNSCIYEVITPAKEVILIETLGKVTSEVNAKSDLKFSDGNKLEINGYVIKRQPVFSNVNRIERALDKDATE